LRPAGLFHFLLQDVTDFLAKLQSIDDFGLQRMTSVHVAENSGLSGIEDGLPAPFSEMLGISM